MLATQENEKYIEEAKEYDLALQFEVFADRRYTDDGRLQARTEQGSVLKHDEILTQVEQLNRGQVVTASGSVIQVQADTICVHGDNADGISLISDIRQLCIAD